MKTTGNTILITGGGSGIGHGLAKAFAEKGNKVIVAGRSLDDVRQDNTLTAIEFDITDEAAIAALVKRIISEHPTLNVLVNNAGISRMEDLLGPIDLATAKATIATNLLGPLSLTAMLVPHLMEQAEATIINNSSGNAFVPVAAFPTYCATKAAIHSYTESLRYQLRDTHIDVLELVPAYVQTELTGPDQRKDPNAMPLDAFIQEVMQLLESGVHGEILVENVKALRFAERDQQYASVFENMNARFAKASH